MSATEGMWATAIMQVIAHTMGIVVDQRNSPGEFVTAPAGQPSGGMQWQHHTHQAARELHDAGDRP